MDKKYWTLVFSRTLQKISQTLSIKPEDIAKGFCDDTTVRKWIKGTRTPNYSGQKHLLSFFEEYFKENPEKDDLSTFQLLCTQVERCFSGDIISSVREIKAMSNNSPAIFVNNVLRLCFGNIKNDNTSMKSKEENIETGLKKNMKTKVVVFDFDGTLTSSTKLNRTTWEEIWIALGYDVKCCEEYHAQFMRGEIDHPTWCKITEEHFKERRMHRKILNAIASRIKLIPGVQDVFKILYANDIKIYIVSGSIMSIIQEVLGFNCKYVNGIKANQFFFDSQGYLDTIVGTKYDFEGKSIYIQEIAEELNIATSEILFVGNSLNDEFVHISGAKTLCINPKKTQEKDKVIWQECIDGECKNLMEILTYVQGISRYELIYSCLSPSFKKTLLEADENVRTPEWPILPDANNISR